MSSSAFIVTPKALALHSVASSHDKSIKEFRLNMEDMITFDARQFLMNRKAEKLHVNIEGLQKIVISNNGKFALFGGQGLHVLDMRTDKFRMIRFDKTQSNFDLRRNQVFFNQSAQRRQPTNL